MGLYKTYNILDAFGLDVDNTSFPKYNLYKEGEEYFLEFALAGYSPEDIQIQVQDGNLIITSEKVVHPERVYIDRFLTSKKFKRKFALDDKVDVDKIESTYENGMLTISLPLKEECSPRTRQIEIKR